MGRTVTQTFATRAEAERAVEHLVQEMHVERTAIFVAPADAENSAGQERSGADEPTMLESGREDAQLAGAIVVSVDVNDDGRADDIQAELANLD